MPAKWKIYVLKLRILVQRQATVVMHQLHYADIVKTTVTCRISCLYCKHFAKYDLEPGVAAMLLGYCK